MKKILAFMCVVILGICLGSGCGRQETDIRVGSLKGPTSMGILFLMEEAERSEADHRDSYEFHMAVGADELMALMVKGELDIALVPANAAAALYQKTDGGVVAIDVNTLGVLYLVTGSGEINSVADLKGKTICLTGKGTTPDAVLQYILRQNGIEEADCTLEYKSEASEVAAILAEDPAAVGLLPQPFVTSALIQNEQLKIVLDMNEEWDKIQGEGEIVTGVTIVRREFLEARAEAVDAFLESHAASVAAIQNDTAAGAALAVKAGIVPKEEIALEAIPQCSLVCITGEEMRSALGGYLEVLRQFQPQLVGGEVPGEDFYY